ncbi:MAG: hypothetical protein ACRDKB_06770 [Actinomycetota bacterium]
MDSLDGVADLVLPTADGERIRFGDLWSDRAAAIVWLRHYG